MTVTEFLRFQLDDGTFQLKACFSPLSEEQYDMRPTPRAMSPREIGVHLCEAYEAFIAHAEGRKHQWGSFRLEDTSKDALQSSLWETRERAVELAVSAEEHAKEAHAYLVAHDAYHVGQLCLVLLACDPGWDPYSIYRH